MITLPSQTTTYSGYVRGFWFAAPVNMTIVGLRVPSGAGTGTQAIHLFRINDATPVVYSSTSTNFTTLYYGNNLTNGVIQSVNIPVLAGQNIGVLGQAGGITSYGPTGTYSSTIGTNTVTLSRLIYQGAITSAAASNYSAEPTSNLGLVEVYYTLGYDTDMGVDSIYLIDTNLCSNTVQPVYARIRNYASLDVDTVQVHWEIDGVAQTSVTYTGSTIPSSGYSGNFAEIQLTSGVLFPTTSPKTVKAWTYYPNNLADEDNSNDTLSVNLTTPKPGLFVEVTPSDTFMCSGTTLVLDADTHSPSPIYIWDNGVITQTRTIYGGGTYWVKVQNSEGCVDYDTVTIEEYANLGI
ncbi:MAG: hypothetical protein QM642_03575, partial [Edaphocola sp.]